MTPIQRFIMRRGEPMKSPYTSPSHTAEWCLATDVDELEQRLQRAEKDIERLQDRLDYRQRDELRSRN